MEYESVRDVVVVLLLFGVEERQIVTHAKLRARFHRHVMMMMMSVTVIDRVVVHEGRALGFRC